MAGHTCSRRLATLIATVALSAAGAVAVGVQSAAAVTGLSVTTTADSSAGAGACGNSGITSPPASLSLREATCLANNIGGAVSISVPAGTYNITNGELQPGKFSGQNVSIIGAGAASTVIDAGSLSRVFDLDPNILGGVTNSFSGVTISGGRDATFGGAGIIAGSGHAGVIDTLTITDSVITNNTVNTSATNKPGGGVSFEGGSLTITNSTISNNSSGNSPGSGAFYAAETNAPGEQLTISGTTFSGNTASAATANIHIGGALETESSSSGPAPPVNISNSAFVNNTVIGSGTSLPEGAAILSQSGNLNVTASTFTGNSVTGGAGQHGGAISVLGGTAAVQYSRITGNTATNGSGASLGVGSGATLDLTHNWWGCNGGPGSAGCDTVAGGPTVSPRLVLTASASQANVVGPNGTSTITAALTQDSAGAAVSAGQLSGFAGVPVNWSDPQPGDAGVASASTGISSGVASVTYNSHTASGPGHVVASLDNQALTVALTVNRAPAITSSNTATLPVNAAATVTVTATGYPTPAISESGAVPPGMTFHDNGTGSATVSGTPTTSGQYPLNLTAANGVGTNATQTLTLTVGQAPAFVSANAASFVIGAAGSFTVTTTGFPHPAINENGALPDGVSLVDNGDGTATLSGTPDSGAAASYPITLTAMNGISPDASQPFTLAVAAAAPAVSITTPPDGATYQFGSVPDLVFGCTAGGGSALLEGSAGCSAVIDSGSAVDSGTALAGSVGPHTVVATATDADGQSTTVSHDYTVSKADQVIMFTSVPPAIRRVGGHYTITATGGGSGQPVLFALASGSAGVCTVSHTGSVTFTGPGICMIVARQHGDANYNWAHRARQRMRVAAFGPMWVASRT